MRLFSIGSIGLSLFWKVRPPPSFPAPRDAMPHRPPALSSSVCAFSSSHCGERPWPHSHPDFGPRRSPPSRLPYPQPIQVGPSSANRYICLVHPPGSPDRTSVSAPALLEFRQVVLETAENRCVRQRDGSIRHTVAFWHHPRSRPVCTRTEC